MKCDYLDKSNNCLTGSVDHETTEEDRYKYCNGGMVIVDTGGSLGFTEDFRCCPRYKTAKNKVKNKSEIEKLLQK
jgi:hypothetical protein